LRVLTCCWELNSKACVVCPLDAVEFDLSPDNGLYGTREVNLGQGEAPNGDVGILRSTNTIEIPVLHDVRAVVQRCKAVDPGKGWCRKHVLDICAAIWFDQGTKLEMLVHM